jgi:3-isopropylmalate/(R)-2-methylmalate dehydratase large subunit
MPEMKDDLIGSNRVFEFGGNALNDMPFDDQIVLTNMAIEGQGFTGIIEPNRQLIQYIMERHSLSFSEVRNKLVYPDKDAKYPYIFDIDLTKIERMIALPGDTQNGIPLSSLDNTPVNFAYIGSCTGGKYKDLKEAAEVLNGRKIADWITMKVQASSLSVFRKAKEDGLIDIFKSAGAQIIQPGCGDCMGATKDAFEKEEIVISDTNRNFPGRMGKKRTVYLANPAVVAASAILGRIGSPQELNKLN